MTQKTLRYLIAVGAAALTLAGPAAAQSVPGTPPARGGAPTPGAPRPTPAPPSSTQPPAGQPPATTSQPPASQPSGAAAATTAGQLSAEDVQTKLAPMHARQLELIELGKIASEKGSNPQVKSVGQKMASDFQQSDAQVKEVAWQRGQRGIPEVSAQDKAGRDQMLGVLRGYSGEQFDREFIKTAIQHLENYVTQTKQLRDSTPGKDAMVKKWIDNVEDAAENNLNAARQAKVTLDKSRGQAKK